MWLPQGQVPRPWSSLREPGTQDPTGPHSPQAARMAGAGPKNLTQADGRCHSVTKTGMGRGSLLSQGLGQGEWETLGRALEPCRTQPQACPLDHPSSPSGQGQGTGWRALGRRPDHLLPHSPSPHLHSADSWLNPLTHRGSSAVPRLWQGTTTAPTNG